MFGLFGSQVHVPSYVTGDKIIPVHFFDDTFVLRSLVVYTLLVFDDVLDPEKLHKSLRQLVEREGWKKLGGRLRQGKDGLQYHVPGSFSASRPAVAFTHVRHDLVAADHPSASRVPKPDEHMAAPALVADPEGLSDLVYPPGCPRNLDDWLKSDRPTLGLHITSFLDKTMLVIYWPHVATDVLGQKAIFEGWTKILQGKEDTISNPVGFDYDPLAEVGRKPTEPHILASKRLNLSSMALFGLRKVVDLSLTARDARVLCIPAICWQRWYADARKELGSEQFLTEGDILTAFWIRIAATHLGLDSKRTVSTNMAMSLRKALQDEGLPVNRPYVSNAIGFANIVLPANKILSTPLSWLALHVRRAIAEQGTRAQLEAYLAMQRESKLKFLVLFGNPGMHHMTVSNWQKANLFDFDFGAAALADRNGRPLTADYVQTTQKPAFPEAFPIVGKDQKGNYWISGYRQKGQWGKVEEELKKYAVQPTVEARADKS